MGSVTPGGTAISSFCADDISFVLLG